MGPGTVITYQTVKVDKLFCGKHKFLFGWATADRFLLLAAAQANAKLSFLADATVPPRAFLNTQFIISSSTALCATSSIQAAYTHRC